MQARERDAESQLFNSFQDCTEHMDILMIHALLDSLFTIFSTMVHLKISPGIPLPKDSNLARGDVSAIMVMVAEQVIGSVALSFPLPAIRKISKSLFNEDIDRAGDEAKDLVGELTNMLVGGAKNIIAEKGYHFDMQTPQLHTGERHELSHPQAGKTVMLPISLEETEFYLELNFR